MLEVKMKAQLREERGKQAAKRLRNSGLIPAVVYGHKEETIPISVDAHEFARMLREEKGDNVIIDLRWDKTSKKAIIKEVQRNPVTSEVIHIDFQHLIAKEKIEIDVPIQLTGTAVGVKEENGVLEHVLRKVSVRCFPKDIPSHVELDVSGLKIGESIHVSDLTIKGVEIMARPEEPVVMVITPRGYEAEEEKAEAEVLEEAAAGEEGEKEAEEKKTPEEE